MLSHHVGIVCDFFYPRIGGVEGHIWALAQCLRSRGHHVVVITGSYATPAGRRVGVRTLTGGLRVYHLPLAPLFDQAILPTYVAALPYLRCIVARERLQLLHGHATSSVLAHECLLHAQLMGLATVYTDHSLYGFADAASVCLAKYLSLPLACIDAAVAVSRVGRANLCLRTGLHPRAVYAIPNAVDARAFTPDPSRRAPAPAITVVLFSRLVPRKGIDLAARVIPLVAAAFPHVRFLVGGDGPKRPALEAMREAHGLAERVTLLGAVPHAGVRDVLVQGHIFLNCSLTEAFCIAILEAACAGCLVVSTPVGGVPEVLPPRLAVLAAAPTVPALVAALSTAIRRVAAAGSGGGGVGSGGGGGVGNGRVRPQPRRGRGAAATVESPAPPGAAVAAADGDGGDGSGDGGSGDGGSVNGGYGGGDDSDALQCAPPDPWAAHAAVRAAYCWQDVADRTARVYGDVLRAPRLPLAAQFGRWLALGPLYGPVAAVLMALLWLLLQACEWARPAAGEDVVPDAVAAPARAQAAAERSPQPRRSRGAGGGVESAPGSEPEQRQAAGAATARTRPR